MKMKTQENIRRAELLAFLSGYLLVNFIDISPNMFYELLKFLNQNNITIEGINDVIEILGLVYNVDILTNYKTQKLTTDYKKIDTLYKEVIASAGLLIKKFEFNNPTEIFALYIHMYRNGYLSYNKHFEYSTDLKDFAQLNGIDVVRGKGVCRSISSMLTDIYIEMDMKSTNLSVNTNVDTIDNLEKLSDTQLEESLESKKFVEIVIFLTKYLKIPNHLVTMVSHNEKTNIYCPTNDGFMYVGDKNKLILANNPKYSMKNFEILSKWYSILGVYSGNIKIKERKKLFKLPSITEEEYRNIYISTSNLCKENIDMLENFYSNNKELYDELYNLSEKQNDLVKRLVPILPGKR